MVTTLKYLKYFINYVELRTKIASVFPFIIAVIFYINNYAEENGIKILNFVIFFIAMLCFDMATTSINHYIAFHKEKDISKYDSKIIMEMNKLGITMKDNLIITIVLVTIATLLGIILVLLSNIGVLLLGMLCFLIGITYSYGPKPISYTPLGEFFSGGTMGIILPVIVLFTQYDHLPFELNPFLIIVFLPLAFLIGSILLGNNLCDLEMDVNNNRYTLAYYTDKKNGVIALYLAVLGALASIALAVYLNYLGIYYLIMFLTAIPLCRNIKKFSIKISKKESFPLIAKNFTIFSFFYIIVLLVFR